MTQNLKIPLMLPYHRFEVHHLIHHVFVFSLSFFLFYIPLTSLPKIKNKKINIKTSELKVYE